MSARTRDRRSMERVSDEFLVLRAGAGDATAFAELARRYRSLLASVSTNPPPGLEFADLYQEALLGLLRACRTHRPHGGHVTGLIALNARWQVQTARTTARAGKNRIVNQAAREGEDADWFAQRLAAPEATDPAVVVELRDELRRAAERRDERAARPASMPGTATATSR